jgi:hypothetical protein
MEGGMGLAELAKHCNRSRHVIAGIIVDLHEKVEESASRPILFRLSPKGVQFLHLINLKQRCWSVAA